MKKNISRKEYCKQLGLLALGGLLIPSTFAMKNHIIIGLQTYSLRDKNLDQVVSDMKKLGIKHIELWEGHVQPRQFQWRRGLSPEQLKQNRDGIAAWRDQLDMSEIIEIKEKLKKADIKILAYNSTFKDNIKDDELDREFQIANVLGTDTINTSATVSVMPRVDKFAKKYKIKVGMHNHSHVDRPNEFATPDSFARGMAGRSKWIGINLDIGHFAASNFDPMYYLIENHDKIYSVHIKDRIRNQGDKVPFGEGDTPIIEVLQLISAKKWNIPAFIEYEYPGEDSFVEVEKCLNYCLSAVG